MDKVNELAAAIGARGVGHARAQLLGVASSERAGVCQLDLWYQVLLRAEGSAELVERHFRNSVRDARRICGHGLSDERPYAQPSQGLRVSALVTAAGA